MTTRTEAHLRLARSLKAPEDPKIPEDKVSVLVLASGSKANCILVTSGERCIMIDAGLSPEQAAEACRALGWKLTKLDGLLLTHSHTDHAQHAVAIALKFGCHVYASSETFAALDPQPPHKHYLNAYVEDCDVMELHGDVPFAVQPIEVQHDAYCLAYRIETVGKSLVIAHDLGRVSSELLGACRGADFLGIEANYDPELLAACTNFKYTTALKDRISGDEGHLSNQDAVSVLCACSPRKLQAVCALHISENTNDTAEVSRQFRAALQSKGFSASLHTPGGRIDLNGAPMAVEAEAMSPVRRANILDAEVDGLISEERRGREESQRRMVLLASMFEEMEQLFEAKEPNQDMCGFPHFTAWLEAKAAGLGISRRQAFYQQKIGRFVLPVIGVEMASKIPIEANKKLALYAETKQGDIPADLVQFAQEHSAEETVNEVYSRLHEAGPMHYDGPQAKLVISAGQKAIKAIEQALERLKPKCGTEDEALIIEWALKALEDEKDTEAAHEREEIETRPVAPPEIAELLDMEMNDDGDRGEEHPVMATDRFSDPEVEVEL